MEGFDLSEHKCIKESLKRVKYIYVGEFMIVSYEKKYEVKWDDFVLNNSINGNFLQTRRFLNYHTEGTFEDASLLFFKNDISYLSHKI